MGGDHGVGLELKSVRFGYRSSRALALDVDVAFGSGRTIILGPNGAGKTTLFQLCATLLQARSGNISLSVGGKVLAAPSRAFRAELGYMPQSPTFVAGLTAFEYLRYAAWLAGLNGALGRKAAEDWIQRVNLANQVNTRCSDLSGGMQRRLAFAAASVNSPALLLLDEPTAGLDPIERRAFREALKTLAHDAVLLVSTHQIDDLDLVADRIAVLSAGRCVYHDTLPAFLELGDRTLPQLQQAESAYAAALLQHGVV